MSAQPLAQTLEISIHALREEGDSARICCSRFRINFYPRPPRGGRRDAAGVLPWNVRISIRTLCEEGDALASALSL